ncbi:MAG: hypothetical protein WA478_10670, partial [Pseudolabrys sp.]
GKPLRSDLRRKVATQGRFQVVQNVYSKETVRTGQAGQADLQFEDDSNLKVESNSSVHLDKFVYDPNKSSKRTSNK